MIKAFVVLLVWCMAAGGPALAATHTVEMTAVEKDVVVDGDGTTYAAWTFTGQFPGPVVRVGEGGPRVRVDPVGVLQKP